MAETGFSQADLLRSQAEQIRASEFLGRSATTRRLFDFLVERSLSGTETREMDIAVEVFDRREAVDLTQDASVRVYIHRLRRRLEEYYAGPGREEPARLSMPKGSYRIEVQATDVAQTGGPAPRPNRMILAALALAIVALGALTYAIFVRQPDDQLLAARRSVPWSTLFTDKRPIFIAVGDYYIFGETDETMNVRRLVREYSINSREGLYEFLMNSPEHLEKYVDLGLRYLPTSVAFAMNDVLNLLNSSDATKGRIKIVLASDLTAEMMKENDIIYIGYLSGLGKLRDPVFAGSRYTIGSTYDEIVDGVTGQKYIAGITHNFPERGPTRDYGFASTFTGPSGNRFVVISGTRDVAIRHTAKELTDPAGLLRLSAQTKSEQAFDALYGVDAIDQLNMRGELIAVSPIENDKVWTVPNTKKFPTE